MRPRIYYLSVSDEKKVDADWRKASRSLQITLWTLWTTAVAGTAGWIWYAAILAQQPVDMMRLAIYCLLVGLVGLIVVTKIEMWVEPWRFLD